MLQEQPADVVMVRGFHADQPQQRLERQLHELLRLPDHVGIAPALQQEGQHLETELCLGEIAASQVGAGQISKTSPGL